MDNLNLIFDLIVHLLFKALVSMAAAPEEDETDDDKGQYANGYAHCGGGCHARGPGLGHFCEK